MQQDPRLRYAHIDAMRGIAVLLVIWLHTSEIFVGIDTPGERGGAWLHDLASTVDFGRIGIVIFFFISGFVIPSSLRGERKSGAINFVVRRFFRLYPAYWLSIPLALIMVWWAFGRQIAFWEIAANFTMAQVLFGATDIEGLYWTLWMELIFYSMCLALFLLGILHLELVLAAIASVALAVFFGMLALPQVFPSLMVPEGLLYWNAHFAFLSIMFTGSIWRQFFEGKSGIIGKAYLIASTGFWTIAFPSIAVLLFVRQGFLTADHMKLFFSYPLATAIFIVGLLYVRITWRPLSWLGEISYSMYLFHPIVISALLWIGYRTSDQWLLSQDLSTYIVAVMLLSIGVAAAVFEFLERPMVELGKRLTSSRPKILSSAERA